MTTTNATDIIGTFKAFAKFTANATIMSSNKLLFIRFSKPYKLLRNTESTVTILAFAKQRV